MGTVITVMNMKGGVGKTTVAMHLGGMFALYKLGSDNLRRVLLIDYDPQFNLTQAFLPARKYFEIEGQRKTCLSILQDDETRLDPYVLQVPGSLEPPQVANLAVSCHPKYHLHIIPSTLDLMYVALGHSEARTDAIEQRFRTFITECRSLYDIVLIDCHPAGSILTKTSLENSDHVVIPVNPQKYAVRGIGLMLEFINAAHAGTNSARPHILFNMVPRRELCEEETIIRSDPKFRDRCLTETLKLYKVFGEPYEGRGFVWHSRKPWSTQAFRNLLAVSEEFSKRIS